MLSFIIAAVVTPGPDMVTQTSLALPMIALYNLSIGIAWINTRRRERRAAAE